MLNKKIQFNKDVFSKLIKHLYLEMEKKDKSREQLFKKAIWPESKLVLNAEYDMLDFNKNDIIFTLDNEKWTMSRLNDLIKSEKFFCLVSLPTLKIKLSLSSDFSMLSFFL